MLNLTDFYNLANIPQPQKRAAYVMIKAGSVMQDIPSKTDPTLGPIQNYRYLNGLPTPGWKPLGSPPTEKKAIPTPYSEQLYYFNDKVEAALLMYQAKESKTNLLEEQADNWNKGFTYDLNDRFFNNDHNTGDSECFVGVRPRLREFDKWQVNPDCRFGVGGGSGIDLSGTLTQTIADNAIQSVQELLDRMGISEGDDAIVYVSDTMSRKLEACIRFLGAGGGWDMTRDAFGRQLMMYRNAKVRKAGRKAPDANRRQAQVIPETQTLNGQADTGGTYGSIVAVKIGPSSLYMQKFKEQEFTDPYLADDGVTVRAVTENAYGLVIPDTYAIGEAYGFKLS